MHIKTVDVSVKYARAIKLYDTAGFFLGEIRVNRIIQEMEKNQDKTEVQEFLTWLFSFAEYQEFLE